MKSEGKMYSRNYGRGDIPAKINLPPSYNGSAIQEVISEQAPEKEEVKPAEPTFTEPSYSFPPAKEEPGATALPSREECDSPKKEKSSFLSGIFADIETEDLILIGIIAALVFDLADRDILLVALVIAAVLM